MTVALSKEEGRKLLAKKAKKPKYRNTKTEVDGIKFDSKREATYYGELKIREKAGEIDEVELQKPFVLSINGQLVCTYKADFAFYDLREKRRRVVDTKGYITPEFRLKAKLMRAIHGIDVEIVK